MFDEPVVPLPSLREFTAGYDVGRARCLAIGRDAAQAHATYRRADHTGAYWEGWSWAVWDYDDVNDLPHTARL